MAKMSPNLVHTSVLKVDSVFLNLLRVQKKFSRKYQTNQFVLQSQMILIEESYLAKYQQFMTRDLTIIILAIFPQNFFLVALVESVESSPLLIYYK